MMTVSSHEFFVHSCAPGDHNMDNMVTQASHDALRRSALALPALRRRGATGRGGDGLPRPQPEQQCGKRYLRDRLGLVCALPPGLLADGLDAW